MLRWVLFICLICPFYTAHAQSAQTGRVMETGTQVVLPNISIQNLGSKQQVTSNSTGEFIIGAKVNDLLLFTAFGYAPDTVLVTDLKYREVFISPIGHALREVQINAYGKVNKQATALPFDKDYHGQTMQYQPDDKYEGYYKGGVTLRVWTSKREEHDRKRLADIAYADKISEQIARVFSNENIALYVPLKGKELNSFIFRYTPNIKMFKAPEFDLLLYLNKSYREFMKLPSEERQKGTIFN